MRVIGSTASMRAVCSIRNAAKEKNEKAHESSHNQYTGEWPRSLCPQSRRFVAPKETHCTPLCEYADIKWCWLIVAYIASRSSPHPSSAFPLCTATAFLHILFAPFLCLCGFFLVLAEHLHLSFSSHYFYTHITILTHSHTPQPADRCLSTAVVLVIQGI